MPVVVPTRGNGHTASGVSLERKPEAAEFSVVALRPVDDQTHTWLAVIGERQFIEVTVESAARLHDALGALLSQLRSDS